MSTPIADRDGGVPVADRIEFVVRLRALPDADPVIAAHGLRMFLKVALRRYGLRCVGLHGVHQEASVKGEGEVMA